MEKQCKIEGCDNKYFCKGYCHLHYSRVRQGIKDMSLESLRGKSVGSAISRERADGFRDLPDDLRDVYGKKGGRYGPLPDDDRKDVYGL